MTDSVPKNGTAARQLWVSIAALSLTLFFGIVAVIFWLGTLSSEIRGNRDAMASHRSDISELKSRIQSLAVQLTELRSQQVETETQFCGNDIVRNLMHAADLREIAMLHGAVFHTTFPTDNAYYPMICRRDIQVK